MPQLQPLKVSQVIRSGTLLGVILLAVMPHTLRIATVRPLPEPDPDEPLLIAALKARNVSARMVDWHNTDEPWESPIATIVRSTWDYPQSPDEFVTWIDRVEKSGRLANPAEILRRNMHKRYLLALRAEGVPIVETVLVEHSSAINVQSLFDERGWDKIVIKPAISAASWMTLSFTRDQTEHAQEYLETMTLQLKRDALIQPYMHEVLEHGERSLIWIDGQFMHSVRKNARLARQSEHVALAEITDDQLVVAERALQVFARGAPLLYARVDLLQDSHGQQRLMELELLEPSLFLHEHPPALERFADCLARFASSSEKVEK